MGLFSKKWDFKTLKANADDAFLRQKWKKACDLYLTLHKNLGFDLRNVQRLAEASRKLGDNEQSIHFYQILAKHYINEGYWAKALAIAKILVSVDPNQSHFLESLSRACHARTPDPQLSNEAKSYPNAQTKHKGSEYVEEEIESANSSLGRPIGSAQEVPLLSFMPSDLAYKFVNSLLVVEIAKDEYFFQEGDKGNDIYLIADGIVEISVTTPELGKLILARLSGGAFFGEFAVLNQTPRSADAQAKINVQALKISREDLDRLSAQHPEIWSVLEDFLKIRMLDTIFARSSAFSSLVKVDRLELARKTKEKSYAAGELIVEQGSVGDEMYIVKKGELKVWQGSNQQKLAIATLKQGDFFGELGLLTGEKRIANIQSETQVQLYVLSRADVADLFKRNEQVLKELKREVLRRSKEVSEVKASFQEATRSLVMV